MLAIWGGSFLEPDLFNYLFGFGIGTNIGANIIWIIIAAIVGYLIISKVKEEWNRFKKRHDEHSKWMANSMHELHLKVDGNPPEYKHPHFDL